MKYEYKTISALDAWWAFIAFSWTFPIAASQNKALLIWNKPKKNIVL